MSIEIPPLNVTRCRAFWQRQPTDRPLLATWVGSYQFSDLFPSGLRMLPEGVLAPEDIETEYFRQDYERLFAQHRAATADVPWAAFPLVVFPWAEAVAGCQIIHREGNIWTEPCIENYEAFEAAGGLRQAAAWRDKLVEFTRWLVALSAGRYPVAISLLRGPVDLLAAMRGAQTSVLDLVDRPESVQGLLDALTEMWIDLAYAQAAEIAPFAGGYGWSIQNLWSEEPGGWFQDDAVAFWSPSLYRRYALPRERRLSQCLPRTGCHLHSGALFTVPELIHFPDLDVIEMNVDVVGKTITQMIPAFQRVLQAGRLYVWGSFSDEDLRVMHDNLSSEGLALQLMADSPEAVNAMIRRVEEIWC